MNFFGIGPMELVFILILALIIFGPGRLPEIGRALGKSIRDFRAMTQEVTTQFSLELEEATKSKEQGPQAPAPVQGATEAPTPTEPPSPPEAAAEPPGAEEEGAIPAGEAQDPGGAEGASPTPPEGEVAG
ncbi:MAG: Sec-independent protein translocase subunit TatA/TatB [Anaerolineae bacterium]